MYGYAAWGVAVVIGIYVADRWGKRRAEPSVPLAPAELDLIPLDQFGHIRSDNPLVGYRSVLGDPSLIWRAQPASVYEAAGG